MGNADKDGRNGERINVSLRLDLADVRALKLEAARRVQAGEATRFDISAIVRASLLDAAWRRRLAALDQEDADAEAGGGGREG